MRKQNKVIITSATTGAMHMPFMSPYLPITPDQIVEDSVGAAEAGASIVHLHARDAETGCPVTDPEVYGQYLPRIKERSDVIINLTTGQPGIRRSKESGELEFKSEWSEVLAERMAAPIEFEPEITSFNMGPMNAANWIMMGRADPSKLQMWEQIFVTATKDLTMQNTWASMEKFAVELGQKRGVVFEYECFDIGHLYALKMLQDLGLVKPPFFIQSVFGFLGGIASDPKHVLHFRQTADDLFGDDYYWSVLAAGKEQIRLTNMAAIMGGNVRVGLEDSLWYGKGQLAKSSAEQVGRIRRILDELGLEVATPDEAREILGTKGKDNVNF
ncbi:3-keto-5-aminohexanoate cleavage protein [Alterisphingorhabdus coralli]|uniref:3-keto-5-aminohexanoate cleavage protein n=1 Tax=Alterisphingorhabdus coralli TaxID=3071408 RepID=A0AA97I0Y8_9SPHN|nr:3-keto-5-aminohexanoate cleavage protein [Parasphingorhabdus sp. SCSIO 66989]WOE75497.1 3-keto-5-aminohexanoate cleavage protein [Parasphingorhabdus sp. SCSIO 66989]